MTGTEILSNLNKPTVYIGEVTEIYSEKDKDKDGAIKEPNSIRFTIPGVTDGITKYPNARLIGNRTRRVEVGDTVFIIKQGSFNNIFFYMPMDISDFIGCAYDNNHYLKLSKNSIELSSGDNGSNITVNEDAITIKNKKDSIYVGEGKVNISTDKASISVTTDEINPTIVISAGSNPTSAKITLDTLIGIKFDANSGKMIMLPPGAIGFSTGVGPASATVPTLVSSVPIINLPGIVIITVLNCDSKNHCIVVNGDEYNITTAIQVTGGTTVSISLKTNDPTIPLNTQATIDGVVTTSKSYVPGQGQTVQVEVDFKDTI